MKLNGQLTIIGLVVTFLSLVVAFALMPAINDVIDDANLTAGSTEESLAGLINTFIILSIIVGFLYFAFPQRFQV